MTATFVVADAHGNAGLLLGLLEQVGIIEQPDEGPAVRVMERSQVQVVQLGDLANCVSGSALDDLQTLNLVREGFIDLMLVGNHEHPYFGGPAFYGYMPDPEVRNSVNLLRNRGSLKAAHVVDDILITHAGVTPWVLRRMEAETPVAIAREINETWREDPRNAMFSIIGAARGGWQKEGGILWSDWSEPKLRKIRQIVGHTVGERVRYRNAAICIDLGAGKQGTRIAGAWIRDGEVEVVIHGTWSHEPQFGVAA